MHLCTHARARQYKNALLYHTHPSLSRTPTASAAPPSSAHHTMPSAADVQKLRQETFWSNRAACNDAEKALALKKMGKSPKKVSVYLFFFFAGNWWSLTSGFFLTCPPLLRISGTNSALGLRCTFFEPAFSWIKELWNYILAGKFFAFMSRNGCKIQVKLRTTYIAVPHARTMHTHVSHTRVLQFTVVNSGGVLSSVPCFVNFFIRLWFLTIPHPPLLRPNLLFDTSLGVSKHFYRWIFCLHQIW